MSRSTLPFALCYKKKAGKWWVSQWSWWTVHGRKTLNAHVAVVVSSCLNLYGCCWPVWRLLFFLSQPQSRISSTLGLEYTMLSDSSLLQPWDPAMLESCLGQSALTLPVVHYLLHLCTMEKRMWSQVRTPKSPRRKLPQIGKLLFPQNTDSMLLIAL